MTCSALTYRHCGGRMPLNLAVGGSSAITLAGSNLAWIVVVAVIALGALGVAGILVKEVLAASEGTENMKRIAAAVQEGASAYLAPQLRSLSVLAALAFFLLLALPADNWAQRVGRSVFFLVRAAFSSPTRDVGMWLA